MRLALTATANKLQRANEQHHMSVKGYVVASVGIPEVSVNMHRAKQKIGLGLTVHENSTSQVGAVCKHRGSQKRGVG